jgi:hypothetical protein
VAELTIGIFRNYPDKAYRYFRSRIDTVEVARSLLFQNVALAHSFGRFAWVGAPARGVELCGGTGVQSGGYG